LESLRPGPGPAREGFRRPVRRRAPAGSAPDVRHTGGAPVAAVQGRAEPLRGRSGVRVAAGGAAPGAGQRPGSSEGLPARPGPVRVGGGRMTHLPRHALCWPLAAQLLVILPTERTLTACLALLCLGFAARHIPDR